MKRIVLKLSGEVLANGNKEKIYDMTFVDEVAKNIKTAVDEGYEIALVVGAGNIWRGRQGVDMDRVDADRMGMLATVINAICMKDAIKRAGGDAIAMTSVPMEPFAERYSGERAIEALESGKVVVFGAGLGIPFLSTDTTLVMGLYNIFSNKVGAVSSIDSAWIEF
jgi:uridylate kinase